METLKRASYLKDEIDVLKKDIAIMTGLLKRKNLERTRLYIKEVKHENQFSVATLTIEELQIVLEIKKQSLTELEKEFEEI